MLTMLAWHSKPDARPEAIAKLLAGDIDPHNQEVKIAGSWHGVAKGYVLLESKKYEPVISVCLDWADMVDIEVTPVVGHSEAKALLKVHSAASQ